MTKKTLLLFLFAICFAFAIGFASNSILKETTKGQNEMKRVIGIGGIFFKCNDPEKVREWYKTHLGFDVDQYGAMFKCGDEADSSSKGFLQWAPFPENTKYFDPSTREFMINYRVENIEALVELLKDEGVTILDSIETYDYGKFVHILDIEDNKIELWEPTE